MAVMLHIDTALDRAYAGISKDGEALAVAINEARNEHASWLHVTVKRLMEEQQLSWKGIHAVSVNHGPGSYTGLRVGMAAAKGFCYAAGIPLIALSCTELIAFAAMDTPMATGAGLYCAMIDARRMEVFTAVYNSTFEEIVAPTAMILDEKSFSNELQTKTILFCGSGAKKFNMINTHEHARFNNHDHELKHHIQLATRYYRHRLFADIAYAEPLYGKSFYTKTKS